MASGRTAALTAERLRAMVDGYWSARGLDEHGRPVNLVGEIVDTAADNT
jgi:hypothetical protein